MDFLSIRRLFFNLKLNVVIFIIEYLFLPQLYLLHLLNHDILSMSLIDLMLNTISLTGLLNKIFKRCYFLNIYSFKILVLIIRNGFDQSYD